MIQKVRSFAVPGIVTTRLGRLPAGTRGSGEGYPFGSGSPRRGEPLHELVRLVLLARPVVLRSEGGDGGEIALELDGEVAPRVDGLLELREGGVHGRDDNGAGHRGQPAMPGPAPGRLDKTVRERHTRGMHPVRPARAALALALVMISLLALGSCGRRAIAWGVLLWGDHAGPFATGTVVAITRESQLSRHLPRHRERRAGGPRVHPGPGAEVRAPRRRPSPRPNGCSPG